MKLSRRLAATTLPLAAVAALALALPAAPAAAAVNYGGITCIGTMYPSFRVGPAVYQSQTRFDCEVTSTGAAINAATTTQVCTAVGPYIGPPYPRGCKLTAQYGNLWVVYSYKVSCGYGGYAYNQSQITLGSATDHGQSYNRTACQN